MYNRIISLFISVIFLIIETQQSIYAQTKEVQINGTLKMYILDNSEEEGRIVSEYRKTDCKNTYLAFVVECDKKVNVTPYLTEEEREWLDEARQSAIMVLPQFKYSAKNFAEKYANKHVRAKGTLHIPGAGWRNATLVVMSMKEIQILDNKCK